MAQVRLGRPRRPHAEKKHHAIKIEGVSNGDYYVSLWVQNCILGQIVVLEVFGAKCEVADLKQRQGMTATDQRSKAWGVSRVICG